jgi:DNA repair photolyase
MANRYLLAPTSQLYFCGLPFRMDTSSQCALGCHYCFSSLRRGCRCNSNEYFDPSYLEKRLNETQRSGVINEWLIHKMPIHFGGMSDPFSTPQSIFITSKILDVLDLYEYPVIISTKKPKELLKVRGIKPSQVIIQVSFSVFNKRIASIIEPNAPSPLDRINAIFLLAKQGYKVIARLQPYIPQYRADILFELLPRLFEAKVDHIILEHLKIPIEHTSQYLLFTALSQIGVHYCDLFKYGRSIVGREIELPQEVKLEIIQEVTHICNKEGITFGAGDNGFTHMSSTFCCCGVDKYTNFDHWFKGNFTNIIKSVSGFLTIDELDKYEYPKGSIGMYINSHSRLSKEDNTIKALLRNKWNRPGTTNAPDTFYGVVALKDTDEQGNTIYQKGSINI